MVNAASPESEYPSVIKQRFYFRFFLQLGFTDFRVQRRRLHHDSVTKKTTTTSILVLGVSSIVQTHCSIETSTRLVQTLRCQAANIKWPKQPISSSIRRQLGRTRTKRFFTLQHFHPQTRHSSHWQLVRVLDRCNSAPSYGSNEQIRKEDDEKERKEKRDLYDTISRRSGKYSEKGGGLKKKQRIVSAKSSA